MVKSMPKLTVKTRLNRILLVGDFNEWNVNTAIEYVKNKRCKNIYIEDMPIGEYKILSAASFKFGEERNENGDILKNRKFSGKRNETVVLAF